MPMDITKPPGLKADSRKLKAKTNNKDGKS